MDQHVVTLLTCAGIAACLAQSAVFSGLNIALFGVSRLRLEVESSTGSAAAARVLKLRRDSNFTLTTILWGNVWINVLLTLLSESLLAGASAFLFSTMAITFLGEITPQGYCSRNSLRVAAALSPLLRVYQVLLYPVAKPSALFLDAWLGAEGPSFYRESDFREVIQRHMAADAAAIDRVEGLGALNFLALDDIRVSEEGEAVDPLSVIELPCPDGELRFPAFAADTADPFLRRVQSSGRKWAVLTDPSGAPRLVLDVDAFLRAALFGGATVDPLHYCHRPIVVPGQGTVFGSILHELRVDATRSSDDVIDHDVILAWGERPRIITGADILGRLLRGIVASDASG